LAAYDCFAGVGSCAPLAGCFTGSFSGVAGFAFSSADFSGVVVDGFGFVMRIYLQYHGNILLIGIRCVLAIILQ
jgi:hypothetical protein